MITQRLCIRYQVLFKVATATLLLFAFGFAERSNAQESRSIELQIEEMGGPKNLEEMESWLTNFYRSPRPDKVVPLAARSFAYFDSKRQSPVPILHGKFVLKESERRELSFLSFASSQRPDEC